MTSSTRSTLESIAAWLGVLLSVLAIGGLAYNGGRIEREVDAVTAECAIARTERSRNSSAVTGLTVGQDAMLREISAMRDEVRRGFDELKSRLPK